MWLVRIAVCVGFVSLISGWVFWWVLVIWWFGVCFRLVFGWLGVVGGCCTMLFLGVDCNVF